MSDGEIAYDIRLEELLDLVKTEIWLNEELQIQPEAHRKTILDNLSKLYGSDEIESRS